MRYRMLFTDLDGTLLDSQGKISDKNKSAVAAAIAKGKQIVICSGRSWMSLERFEKMIGLDKPGCYGAAFNGGIVYETQSKKFLYERTMENAFAMALVHDLKEMGADLLVYTGDRLFAERETPDLVAYRNMTRIQLTLTPDFSGIKSDIIKIIIRGRQDGLQLFYEQMKPRYGNACNIFFSSSNLLEFSHPDAHKGKALEVLSAHTGVPLSEMIAMGDQMNDISMLQTAGLGIAVSNAEASAKAAANRVLDVSNDQDALSVVIHQYLLEG